VDAYLSLLISALLAATLLPAYSELLFAALVNSGYDPLALWLWATTGNTLGSAVNWTLGRYLLRFQERRWFPFKAHTLAREIHVPPEERVLGVEVLPSATEYRPGERATVRLKLTDVAGAPFVGSTVVAIYDKALEYISGGSNVADIKKFFWEWRRQHRAAEERQHGRPGQRQAGDRDVHREVAERRAPGMAVEVAARRVLLRAQRFQRQVAMPAEREERAHQHGDGEGDEEARAVHAGLVARAPARLTSAPRRAAPARRAVPSGGRWWRAGAARASAPAPSGSWRRAWAARR